MNFQTPPPAGGFGSGSGPGQFGPIGPTPSMSSDRLAVSALVLGIVSIPSTFCCMAGLPLGIAAVCVALNARKKMRLYPDLHHGERYARAGFWCGIAGIAITVIYVTACLFIPFVAGRSHL